MLLLPLVLQVRDGRWACAPDSPGGTMECHAEEVWDTARRNATPLHGHVMAVLMYQEQQQEHHACHCRPTPLTWLMELPRRAAHAGPAAQLSPVILQLRLTWHAPRGECSQGGRLELPHSSSAQSAAAARLKLRLAEPG